MLLYGGGERDCEGSRGVWKEVQSDKFARLVYLILGKKGVEVQHSG